MILVFGSFNADYVWRTARLPAPGETLIGSFSAVPGGKGFNQAMAAHRLGAPVQFVCGLGTDGGAVMARAAFAAEGLPCHVFDCDAPTGTASVVVDRTGRNQIVVAPGANLGVRPAHLAELADSLARSRVVLCQLESDPASVMALLQRARAAGALAMLNPAPAPTAEMDLRSLLESCDLLTPNESEFQQLLALQVGIAVPDTLAELPDAELHALCRQLGVPTVIITLGAAGAFWSSGAGFGRVASLSVDAIDTTGAGDCFNGALATSLLAFPQRDLPTHLRFACAAAALSTEQAGAALAMPRRTALEARWPQAWV